MFIPRQPVVDNQFCEYVETSTTGGVGGAVAHAGAAVYIGEFDAVAANTKLESLVTVFDGTNPGGTEQHLFGFLMQKIKTGYHEVHPAGYILKQDFGSSDAIAQAKYSTAGAIDGTQKVPVGVAHDGGIWDTTHYTSYDGSGDTDDVLNYAAINAGQILWVVDDDWGRLTSDATQAHADVIYPTFSEDDGSAEIGAGAAIVIKGVSAAKVNSTWNGKTLYPIRVKLLV